MAKKKPITTRALPKPLRSFSQLSLFHQCKLAFKYGYIDNLERTSNFWAEAGTLGHSIFEEKDKGEIDNCAKEWEERFTKEVVSYPQIQNAEKIVENLYNGVLVFFKKFKGWRTIPELLEHPFETDMGDYTLRGFIDRVSYIEEDELGIQDYKISNPYKGKELREKMRQLYLYSKPLSEMYGRFPKKLTLFFFKTGTHHTEDFNEEYYKEALSWAEHTNMEIMHTKKYPATKDEFYCKNLCSFYENCEAWKK
jgi:putative RecB family exonuclease